MLRVLRLPAVASLALAATAMGASAAAAATHHKPGNCSVTKRNVAAGHYREVAVKVVCTAHSGVHSVVSRNGDVTTIVRGSGRSVAISRSEVSGGSNFSQVNQSSGTGSSAQINEVSGGANYGQAVGSQASAVSSASSSSQSSQP